jgi:glucose-1-phosphate thymidylyltransferase
MKALILAAGYATRLYPLTENFPKPLLDVGGRALLDRLADQLVAWPGLDGVALVTNRRFVRHFTEWARARTDLPVRVLDDGSQCNEARLGAVGDMAFALREADLADDLLVAAADNLFDFPFAGLQTAFRRTGENCLLVHRVLDPARRLRTGIAELGLDQRVIGFREKPAEPRSEWGVPPLYALRRETLARIPEYLASGGSSDAPGHLIEWLVPRVPFHAVPAPGAVYDIGTLESLAACRAKFASGASGPAGATGGGNAG